ncbi:PASTA domain-containing protein, partial [Streptomyces rubiginosohelvolus]
PNVVGTTVKDAQKLADNTNIILKVGPKEECKEQPKGKICRQTPEDGKMKEQETLTVFVSSGPPKVEVPDVTNQSEEDARKNLEAKGFTVNVTSVESDQAEPDTVLEQSPKGGAKAEENSEVTLKIATEKLLTMPPVTGRSYDDAVNQLKGLGFTNIGKAEEDSDKPANEVIGQTPEANQKVGKNTTILLKVSKGPTQPPTVAVPEVRTKKVSEAKQLLNQAGFTQIQFAPNSPQDDNATVINIDPQPNTQADPATTVITLTTVGGGGNIFGGPNGGGGGH